MAGPAAMRTISAPRPTSAWVMALVASATLWITGEIGVWVIPVQLACYAVSFFTRNDPPVWRKSPGWLNVGMFCITGVTIAKALAGSPATLSLAYFASLSQGLQLVDARPRKSEFLLVALSLFQVILASNLTDSVFFPPLVLAFLVSVTWTLLVYTLRTEAANAGDSRNAQAALTPALVRTTALLSVLSIGLALIFFVMLPRMKTSMLRGGGGSGMAVSGFSDRVTLGSIGRIRKDHRVVLRVETLEGEPAPQGAGYWRGLAFDHFDGRTWSISASPIRGARIPVTGIPRFGVSFGAGPRPGALVQRIVREPVQAGVLFGAGPVQRIEGPMQRVQRDANGGLYHPAGLDSRVRYTLWTDATSRDDPSLARDHAAAPQEPGGRGRSRSDRYLALPALDRDVHALASEITAGASSDAERLARLEAHLRANGRYTDDPPEMGGSPDGRSPVEAFLLGDLAGHCEYFATSMVMMSRSLDIPTRLVNGFAGGQRNSLGGFTELTRADAHAWVEAHFAEAGWVRYDPTPPDMRWRAASGLSVLERLAELGSVIELWWFQRVVDFDSVDQVGALRSAWLFLRDARARLSLGAPPAPHSDTPPRDGAPTPELDGITVDWPPVLLTILALGGLWHLGHRRVHSVRPNIPEAYRRALRLLARHRLPRSSATTARAYVAQVRDVSGPRVAGPLAQLTEAYLAQRFGAQETADDAAQNDDLSALRAALRADRRRRREAQRAP